MRDARVCLFWIDRVLLDAPGDWRAALALAARAYVMESGMITLSGEARALLADSRVREAYLGEAAA